MVVVILIIVFVIAAAAIAVAVTVLRSIGKDDRNIDIHMSGGADLKKGFISHDNNFFKGVTGEMDETVAFGRNYRNDSFGKEIKLINLITSDTDTVYLRPEIIMGRMEGKGVFMIRDSAVSKKHCRLFFDEDGIFIEDLNSLNHTFLNGQIINGTQKVNCEDIIKLGSTKYKLMF